MATVAQLKAAVTQARINLSDAKRALQVKQLEECPFSAASGLDQTIVSGYEYDNQRGEVDYRHKYLVDFERIAEIEVY